jgi:hypothetical protein
VERANRLILEKVNRNEFSHYFLKEDKTFNTTIEINYHVEHIDTLFTSISISKHIDNYSIVEDSLKDYLKPSFSKYGVNLLYSHGIVDINKVFEEGKMFQFLQDNQQMNSAFETVKVEFFYIQNSKDFVIRFNSMSYTDPNLNISIDKIIPYLKREHPFTKYLQQLLTSKN